MIVLTVLEIVLIVLFGFFLGYLAILSLLAMLARPRKILGSPPRRFAMVIPAHNEELSLGRTVKSLSAITYPRSHFDIIVIADNCTDRTAEVGRTEGAIVYERVNPELRGKGYALRWCFDRILSQQPGYDAVVVIDADSTASENFLSLMNYYLNAGSKAIQCSDMVKPQPDAWSSEITRLGFTLYNHVRPLGRSVINCSAGIRGNGMCFSTETLLTIPWNTYSLNEDLEYGLILLLNGINVEFAPEAKVFAMMPTNARNAESQRARWERGRFPVIRKYGPRLVWQAIKKFSYRPFDAFVELITPAFVNLFGAGCMLFALTMLLWIAGVEQLKLFGLLWGIIVLCGFIHVLVGLLAANADRLLYRAFFYIPRYALWKFMLYTKLFRQKSTQEWVRTARDHVVGASEGQ